MQFEIGRKYDCFRKNKKIFTFIVVDETFFKVLWHLNKPFTVRGHYPLNILVNDTCKPVVCKTKAEMFSESINRVEKRHLLRKTHVL